MSPAGQEAARRLPGTARPTLIESGFAVLERSSARGTTTVLAEGLQLSTRPVDYVIMGAYFTLVLGIGFLARRKIKTSLDFFLSGRSLPAWVTGLAYISANLGAIELMGMSANGAEYGVPTFHYYLIGAIPAMVFLGLVLMPFYYGSKARSVPEFLLKRFGKGAHLFISVIFSVATLMIAGVNLYALALILNALLGWPLPVGITAAAVLVLAYTALGGLTAAIYNEVFQFFLILAGLVPLTVFGLHAVGGWQGLYAKVAAMPGGATQTNAWPAAELTGFANPVLSVVGIAFGLGFVLSFGTWTTNFAEVQRAMAAKDMSAARRTPLIGAFPKLLVPLVIVIPGMTAGVLSPEMRQLKATGQSSLDYNDALLVLIRDMLPNGLLGVAITGLLASFMAGMAANISSFNTVFTYDLWQDYLVRDRSDRYYLAVGRWATTIGTLLAIGTAFIASTYDNMMDYIQSLASIFNAPLFATFILGVFWKRMTPAAGWSGLMAGTVTALGLTVAAESGVIDLPGQGASFLAAGSAFVVDAVLSVVVSTLSRPKPDAELVGLVHGLTERAAPQQETSDRMTWYRSPGVLAGLALAMSVGVYLLVG